MNIISKIILTLFVLSTTVLAQLSSRLELSSAYYDNVFRSPESIEDFISDLSLDLSYRFNNSNLQIFYYGNYIFFRNLK